MAPLAAVAVLAPLTAPIATAADTAAPPATNAPGANFEGDTVGSPSTNGDAGAQFIGGTAATVSEYPPIIAQIREGGARPEGQNCTGNLVAPRKVLIAAHCYGSDLPGAKSMVYGLDDLADYQGGSGTGFQFAKVISQAIHPKYVRFDTSGYDVAVATLDRDIKPLNGVFATFATSADKDVNLVGRKGLGFGYGKKDVNDNLRDVTLDKAELPVVAGTNGQCQGTGQFSNATMICAGTATGRPVTVLPGDSGGPLLFDGKIYGLSSWGRGSWDWWNVYSRLNNDMGDWAAEQVGPVQQPESSIGVEPGSVKVQAGTHVSTTVTSKAGSTAGENITLSASGLPAGVKAIFSPTAVKAGEN
ncbi:MAG: trypsin-like serine protease, partial [Actinomycetota bacterium]|nr:trypsin-like serine protease [Actinomycetota bacterium]